LEILDFKTLKKPFPKGTVLTLGNFDGVHRGHLEIIDRLLATKNKIHLPSVLVTYFPNPAIVLGKNKDHKSIYSESKKQEILAQFGIDYLLTIPFTEDFSNIRAYNFIHDILVAKLNPKHIIIGYNHFFGKGREGDFSLLEKYSSEFGYLVEQISPVYVGQEKVSSSLIRSLIQSGNMEQVHSYLSRPFSLQGIVVKGFQRGRTISFPTANIELPVHSICPGIGVYAGYTILSGKKFISMVNIGKRPTFDGESISIESHLLDFEEDIYGQSIEQFFLFKIREEQKFESIDELVSRLQKDKEETIRLMQGYPI
jgi:riboflavin kinase/FMN adenylyltransferase